MTKYRKKPVVVEAHQWHKNGDHPLDFSERVGSPVDSSTTFLSEGKVVRRFRRPDIRGDQECRHCGEIMHIHGWIETYEGGHRVCPGDWIITGIQGELYPCKPDIFQETYEAVDEALHSN